MLVILSGVAGAGKDTIKKEIIKSLLYLMIPEKILKTY